MVEIPPDLKLDRIPVCNPAVVARTTFDDGMVLVNSDTGLSLALNSTGALVWGLIDGNRDPGEIARKVAEVFTESPDSVTEDVDAYLQVLAKDGFIGYEVISGKEVPVR